MNIRLFSIAILISALPHLAQADAAKISLNHGDFVAAERTTRNGETLVRVRLSKSGKAKFKKLNEQTVDRQIHSEIAGVESNFTLREPIKGDSLEMGPLSERDADKVVKEINKP
jgi:hypothetical protein